MIAPEDNWVDIPGTFYHYQINELAQVRRERPDGSWRRLYGSIGRHGGHTYRQFHIIMEDRKYRSFTAASLMRDAFMGGPRPGMVVVHLNGSTLDDELVNLGWSTVQQVAKPSNRKVVMKIDRNHRAVAVFPSVAAAAREAYVSQNVIYNRVKKLLKEDEFEFCGYSWRYEK